MGDVDLLAAYRALLGGAEDGESCWWYLGLTFAKPDGLPEVPVIQAETIMVYRTETVSPDCLKVHWREIGYFRDLATGEPATTFRNPVTGTNMKAPPSFEEGPGLYTMRAIPGGLHVTLEQAHAKILSIELSMQTVNGRLQVTQTEHKIRGFPLPDGTMPDPESGAGAICRTVLSLFCDAAGATDGGPDGPGSANAGGLYDFTLDRLPGWMGFGAATGGAVVKGVMRRAEMDEQLNPAAWQRLEGMFPNWFTAGRVTPPW